MAAVRSFEWVRRYSVCLTICCLIFAFQVFLACKFFPADISDGGSAGERRESLGKSPVNLEDDGGVSSRKYREGFLTDDEDIAGNSNQVHHRHREKVPPDKPQVATQTKSNRTAELRLEELDFVPNCEITGREAVSAIHRARSQQCKQELANLTCMYLHGNLYPKRLPNQCPSLSAGSAGKSLGCYQDEKTFRLLSGYYSNLKTNNSPQQCINLCLQSGFQYAGVQYSTECFCGSEDPPQAARLPDSSCNMPCPAEPRAACGGFFTVNIYQTGISQAPALAPRELPENPSERPARVAFLLTINGRAVRQVRRLIRTLFHTDHYFYIHVDARQDYLFRELLPLERELGGRVHLARRRLATIWGGASLLQMLLFSMKDLLDLRTTQTWDWDFVINLSESDFPVKSNEQLVKFLTANKERNFVKSFGRDVQRFIQKQGLDKTFHECEAHMWRAGDRQLPWGVQLDGGSDWVALSHPFVEYVAGEKTEDDELLAGLKTVFRYTLLPAESFFHTVLRNSRFCRTYVDNNLHVTNWKRRLGCKCQYRHVVDWCGCSPNDFKLSDWPRLQATEDRQVFFARKFEPMVNQAVIKQLEDWLNIAPPPDTPGLDSYWQSAYHYADLSPAPDDALVTVAHSLARIASRSLCPLIITQLLEVTSYHHDDLFQGSLIMFEAKASGSLNQPARLESWVKTRSKLHSVNKKSSIGIRLKNLFVSSEFDPKEQISRNLLGALGPFSVPVAVLELSAAPSGSVAVNVSLLWIDPVGWLADITEVHIEETAQVLSSKPGLKNPLRPGVWSTQLVGSNGLLAQTSFLVVPLQFMSGAETSPVQAEFLHSGPSQPYAVSLGALPADSVPDPNGHQASVLLRKAIINARRSGKDLKDWIDLLVNRFYSVVNSCVVKSENLSQDCPNMKTCSSSFWSSQSPDSKSVLGSINSTTGRLH